MRAAVNPEESPNRSTPFARLRAVSGVLTLSEQRTTSPGRRVTVDAELVRTHQGMVWRYLRFLGAPTTVAEELVQEVFLVLLRDPVEDQGAAALGAWLRGVARNLLRRARRARRPELEGLDEAAVEAAWSRYARDDDAAGYHEALRHCLDGLEARERAALEARYVEGASREAVAREMDVAVEGVKSVLRRAKAKLRACVERRLGDG